MHTTNWCSSLCLTIGIYEITMSKSFSFSVTLHRLQWHVQIVLSSLLITQRHLHIVTHIIFKFVCNGKNFRYTVCTELPDLSPVLETKHTAKNMKERRVREREKNDVIISSFQNDNYSMLCMLLLFHRCCFFYFPCAHCNQTQQDREGERERETLLHHKKQPNIKVDIN